MLGDRATDYCKSNPTRETLTGGPHKQGRHLRFCERGEEEVLLGRVHRLDDDFADLEKQVCIKRSSNQIKKNA